MQRRLAAILAADVVGYSRLMAADEAGTLAALKALRADVIDPAIAAANGRMVKLMGDGALVEFASIVDAVECAVAIQREVAAHNEALDSEKRIEFRIGINLGEVIVDGDDIYGDGVNIAARLEGLARPGGICVSAKVFEEVSNKLDVGFEDLGPQEVKNIPTPVRAYHVMADEPPTGAALALPDKPSIAVLAFANMSGDPEQEYFADGIAEDIITALSRFNWFFVIARNSSFAYKGRSPDVRAVAAELGVQYVLEGSVRKAGTRVRITAQLVDALSGRHVWAERYDRELTDIFEVQDEITTAIVGNVAPSFVAAEAQRAARKAPDNLDSWDLTMRANAHAWHHTPAEQAEARRLLESAVERDPDNTVALVGLATNYLHEFGAGLAPDPAANHRRSEAAAQRALALGD